MQRLLEYVYHLIIVALLLCGLTQSAIAGGLLSGPNVQVDSGDGIHVAEPDVDSVDGSNVFAVWKDDRDNLDQPGIYLAKSTNGGATWGTNVRVSLPRWEGEGLEYPQVAVAPGNKVYVAWHLPWCASSFSDPSLCGGTDRDDDVHLARSTNGGTTFDKQIWLWDGGDGFLQDMAPALAVDQSNGYVYGLMHDLVNTGFDIYLMGCNGSNACMDNPNSSWWQVDKINGQSESGRPGEAVATGPMMSLVAYNGVVCAAWEDVRSTNSVYGACSTDQGQSFGAAFRISASNASSPQLAFDPSDPSGHTLYAAYKTGEQAYLTRSTNLGQAWSTAQQVTQVPTNHKLGGWDMSVDGNGKAAIAWATGRDYLTSFVSDLYLSMFDSQGTVGNHIKVNDNSQDNTAAQFGVAIAASGDGEAARAVMVWQDDRHQAEEEIWSGRAALDSIPPTAPTNLRATPGDTVVDLTWNASTDSNGVQGYYVVRSNQSGGPTYTLLNPKPLSSTSYRDVGLATGTYYYKVFAVDVTGNAGPASSESPASVTAGSNLPVSGNLAYQVGADVRLNALPGLANERTLAQGTAPLFSVDGQRVYYSNNGSVYSRALDGSGQQTYTTKPNMQSAFDIASDNVNAFAWIQKQQYTDLDPVFEQWDVYEPHYSDGTHNYTDLYEFANKPSLAPGGHWMAYTSLGQHYPNLALGLSSIVVEYAYSALAVGDLTKGEIATFLVDTDYQDPAYSPNGNWLVVAADFTGQYEIWKAQVQADGKLTNFTQLTRAAAGQQSLAPAWSPDGEWLVFMRGALVTGSQLREPVLNNPLLYIVHADGSSLRALNVHGQEPDWYSSGSVPQDREVYIPGIRKR